MGAIKTLLVWYWPDVGLPCLKYSESFAKIRDAVFRFVCLCPKWSLIVTCNGRKNILFARANAF